MANTKQPKMLSVADIVGSGICVSSEDGQKVYAEIASCIDAGQPVRLSFKRVDRLTTAFLNAAVGQLYNEYSDEQIRRSIFIVDMDSVSTQLLGRVLERAKKFFRSPDRISSVTKNVLDED